MTLGATPWKFEHGEACQVGFCGDVRSPAGNPGSGEKTRRLSKRERNKEMSLKVYDLAHHHVHSVYAGVAVNPECERLHRQVPRRRRRLPGPVGRHHAPLHPHGCSPCMLPSAHQPSGENDYPLWRFSAPEYACRFRWGNGAPSLPRLWRTLLRRFRKSDIVVINTGFHHKWADTDEYFGLGPGANQAAAHELAGEQEVEMMTYGSRPMTIRSATG